MSGAKAKKIGLVVQLVRIHACHAWGRGFESRPDRYKTLKENSLYGCKLRNPQDVSMSWGFCLLRKLLFMKSYTVYINYSEKFDKYYIGQTENFESRILLHNAGLVKSTSPYVPWVNILLLEKASRSEAMALEKKLKNLNRLRLIAFIEKYK